METLQQRRMRTGKGLGNAEQAAVERLQITDVEAREAGEPTTGVSDQEEMGQERRKQLALEGRTTGEATEAADMRGQPNPFWSTRAQEEMRLRATRPDFLPDIVEGTGIQRSGESSSSTELRAVTDRSAEQQVSPNGPPVVYGPQALRTTVDRETVAEASMGENQERLRGSGMPVTQAGLVTANGLNDREREVLSAMKDAMMRIADQNEELLGQNQRLRERVERLEEERATSQGWKSAEETADQAEQPGIWVQGGECNGGQGMAHGGSSGFEENSKEEAGSIRYQLGYEQGYLAAKEMLESMAAPCPCPQQMKDTKGVSNPPLTLVESRAPVPPRDTSQTQGVSTSIGAGTSAYRERTPPPNPFRHIDLHCNTTPQGTPVPKGPPPGQDQLAWGQSGLESRLGEHAVGVLAQVPTWPVNHSGLGPGPLGVPRDMQPGNAMWGSFGNAIGSGMGDYGSLPQTTFPPSGVSHGQPLPGRGGVDESLNNASLPVLPVPPSDNTRDPFAPGDRVYWQLPTLAEPLEESDPATRAADWLELLAPIMSDLSAMSGVWWQRVLAESRYWYNLWCCSAAVDRGLIRPVQSLELQGLRFRRLESRAYSMLQAAVPVSIREELVANREVHCVALVYHVLRIFQPGGLQERTTLLDVLSNPGTAGTAVEAVQKLRAWGRALSRAVNMQISIPDASLILRGLDVLAEPLLKKHQQVSFRCSQARNALQLDHRPTLQSIKEFVKILQSEFDMLSVSSPLESGNKKPKLAAMQQGQDTGKGKGNGKENGKTGEGKGAKAGGSSTSGKDGGMDTKGSGSGNQKGEGKTCSFYLTDKGCSKGRQCTFVHQFGKAKGESRCYNCGSTEHRQNECTRPTGGGKSQSQHQGKGKGGKGVSSTPAQGQGADLTASSGAAPVSSSGAANNKAATDNGATAPGGVPSNQHSNQGGNLSQGNGNKGQSVTNAQAQVLEEAQKLLKSLRIAAFRVPENNSHGSLDGVDHSPERSGESTAQMRECPEEERPRARQVVAEDTPEVFVPAVALRRTRMPTGLLDGGATHALRMARQGEWEGATPTRVALAVGSQDLRVSALGTVLSQEPIAPIVPLGLLVDLLGCRVAWNAGQCTVIHPRRGELGVWLEDNCPVVSERDCLELITEIEQHRANRLRQALHIRALSLGIPPECESGEGEQPRLDRELALWLKTRFPEAPDWLLLKSLPALGIHEGLGPCHIPGLNRRARKSLKRAKHIVLHVFSGRTRAVELTLGSDVAVVNLDVLYGSNVLDERVYAAAISLCSTGKVDAVVGGPPCATNSILRERGAEGGNSNSDGGPRPIRGRTGLLRFGLPTNSPEEQKKVEEHTILITRFLTLHHVAEEANPKGALCALENPDDPLMYLPEGQKHSEIPSLWAWPEILALLRNAGAEEGPSVAFRDEGEIMVAGTRREGAEPQDLQRSNRGSWWLAQFDQGVLGHIVRKTSAVLTNSWVLFQTLHELRGPGIESARDKVPSTLDERIKTSGQWAKWAPGLCKAIGHAIMSWISTTRGQREEEEREGAVMLKALTRKELEFKKHCEEGHMVFRKDCRACLQGQMRSHVHRRQKHHGSNTFCLTMDLVGPWKPGKDHVLTQPATRFLIAALSVPCPESSGDNIDKDRAGPSEEVADGSPEGDNGVLREEREERVVLDNYEEGEEEEELESEGGSCPEDVARRKQRSEEAWLKEAERLREPVPTHDIIFCEPLTSKKSSEVLRAIQRVWVRILGLGLTVRRLHTDGGREFCNRALDAWALARDLHHTYSIPSDPKSNGRIENWVKHAKAGIRTLLCSEEQPDTTQWPSALRQWAEQRMRRSLKLLSVPDPIRPLPPFGTRVVVKNRQWSRKTPHDSKAIVGKVICPAANIPNASVLALETGQFYVAPVVYQNVLEPVQFHGHVANDIPPAPPRRIRGKTGSATIGRGESEEGDLLSMFREAGDADSRGVDDGSGLVGDAGVRGDAIGDDEDDEFEGMIPDEVLFGGSAVEGVSVKNLWCEEATCRLCETPRSPKNLETCAGCGTWQGRVLNTLESEREAEKILSNSDPISRSDVNALLRMSMQGWKARARPCDKEAGSRGSKGWTLGQYVYGSRVGITRETYRRPQLTKLLNRYLRQTLDSQVSWTALRVTCDYQAGPHVDCNEPGSRNVVVPISWFDKGQIWIEGIAPEGQQQVEKEIAGEQRLGYLIGGSAATAYFDPRKNHAVEPALGSRRVVVGYTPRLFDRLSDSHVEFLRDLEFNLCSRNVPQGDDQEQNVGSTAEVGVGDTQESNHEEEGKAGFSPGGEGSNVLMEMEMDWVMEQGIAQQQQQEDFLETLHNQYVSLRQIELDTRKHFDEELEIANEQGWVANTDHVLAVKEWVQDLEQWVITQDASGRLCAGVGESEATVLRARLRKFGVNPEAIEAESTWVPLSGFPLEEPEKESNLNIGLKPPGHKAVEASPAAPLQTVSVSHKEVLANVEGWRPSIGAELESVFERHQALQRTSRQEVEQWISQGKVIEYLPSKALFHKKGGTGRQKTRIVACGNFATTGKGSEEPGSTYAGGLDSTSLRIQLAHCGRSKAADSSWTAGSLDIRTAFLLAPLEQSNRILVLRPPKVLIDAGVVHHQELWYATGAIYGLREAPAAWSSYRDSEIPNIRVHHGDMCLRLVKSNADQNIWYLKPEGNLGARPFAILGVYVDDMLATGPREILDNLFHAIQTKWETSRPQFASDKGGISFCGVEILDSGAQLHLHQKKYLADLLNRYPEVTGGAQQPGLKEPDDNMPSDKTSPDLARIRLAQKLAGELLWIATKTRPDLVYITSRIGQMVTRNVEFAIQLAYNALRYLRSTAHYEIIYGQVPHGGESVDVGPLQDRTAALEAYADASFAPGNDRSQTGIVLVWNQVPITWLSMRQPCASLSTAESELQSSIDALALTEGFLPLLQELESQPIKTLLYNDNQGAVTVMKIPQGSWRTRHLRLKAAWFFEQLESNKYFVFHLPGKYMLGDLCTKTLQGGRIKELLQMMSVDIVDKVEGESGVVVRRVELAPNDENGHSKNPISGQGGSIRTGGADLEIPVDNSCLNLDRGEGSMNSPGNPGMSLLRRAFRLLLGAACVRRSLGKVIITVEETTDEGNVGAWLISVLVVLGVILLCCGLTWMASRSGDEPEGPRIQRMRAEEVESDDDLDQWSLVSNPTHAQGLRRRPQRTRSDTESVPQSSRQYLNPPGDNEDLEVRGTPQAQGSENIPEGPRNTADPGPDTPSYPNPRYETLSSTAAGSSHQLGSVTSERGFGRSIPLGQLPGVRSANAQAPPSEINEVRGDGLLVGAVASYLDDVLYVGLPQHAPVADDISDRVLAPEVEVEHELERHTSEEDGMARNPMVTDPLDTTVVPEVRADVGEIDQQDRPPLYLCVYPGFILHTPPREFWPPQPDWGGFEALFHQSIPRTIMKDFNYWSLDRGVFLRLHAAPRRRLYVPSEATLPPGLTRENLTGRRRTFVRLLNPVQLEIHNDRLSDSRPQRQLARAWVGRTEFELQFPRRAE